MDIDTENEKILICNNCELIWLDKTECTCGCKTLTATHESNKEYAQNYIEANNTIINIIKQKMDEGISHSNKCVIDAILDDIPFNINLIYEIKRRADNCKCSSEAFDKDSKTAKSFLEKSEYLLSILDYYNDIKNYIK